MQHHSVLSVLPDFSHDAIEHDLLVEIQCWNDGLLTVAAIGPQGVSTREWLSVVWSRIGDTKDYEWARGLIESVMLSDWRDTVEVMRRDPSAYVPKFVGLDDMVAGAMFWAEGFRAGMALRPAAWRSLGDERAARRYLAPIMLLLLDDSELLDVLNHRPLEKSFDVAEFRRDCAAGIGTCVAGLYRYWHRRGAAVQAVGRNAPCPCGSGRKYKKCCTA